VLIAALDTATLTLSCALVELAPGSEPRFLCERTDRAPARAEGGALGGHSARLPGALTDLLVSMGKTLPDVEGYAVGLGPGSFTGLRIGLATWKGLAYANRRPIVGASSLAAMALEAAATVEDGTVLVPLLDAKKAEVYAGFYRAARGKVDAALPEAALPPQALLDRLAALPAGAPVRAFGEGYAAFEDALRDRLPRLPGGSATPHAFAVARLAAGRLLEQPYDAQALFALEPHYVRPSEAELRFPAGLGPGAQK
jgi:tRNA threonylcarbamoyladenosine biosynthesis protein TsaB